MLASFATQSVTRVRPTLKRDGHGNLEPDWSDTNSAVIKGCSVQPGGSQEDLINRAGVLVQWTVYAPVTADVGAGDAVEYLGVRYAVNGEPTRWNVGFLNHLVVSLERWNG